MSADVVRMESPTIDVLDDLDLPDPKPHNPKAARRDGLLLVHDPGPSHQLEYEILDHKSIKD